MMRRVVPAKMAETEYVPMSVDLEVDAAYIEFAETRPGAACTQIVVEYARLRGEIALDLDVAGNLLGIELIGYRAMRGDPLS
jgi:uncharacterized protein YuzE